MGRRVHPRGPRILVLKCRAQARDLDGVRRCVVCAKDALGVRRVKVERVLRERVADALRQAKARRVRKRAAQRPCSAVGRAARDARAAERVGLCDDAAHEGAVGARGAQLLLPVCKRSCLDRIAAWLGGAQQLGDGGEAVRERAPRRVHVRRVGCVAHAAREGVDDLFDAVPEARVRGGKYRRRVARARIAHTAEHGLERERSALAAQHGGDGARQRRGVECVCIAPRNVVAHICAPEPRPRGGRRARRARERRREALEHGKGSRDGPCACT